MKPSWNAARRRTLTIGMFAVLATAGLAACEPSPREQLTVTSTADGHDDAPGDGTCASADAGGACTLRAAIEEANALGPTDITFSAATPSSARSIDEPLIITGDVTVRGNGFTSTGLTDYRVEVASGARARLSDLQAGTNIRFSITVAGSLDLERVAVAEIGRVLSVLPGGRAVLVDTDLFGGVLVEGTLAAVRSTLLVSASSMIQVAPGGQAHLRGSVLDYFWYLPNGTVCTGETPVSHGRNASSNPACAPGDADVVIPATGLNPYGAVPAARSPLVDAIPVGDPGCTDGATDLYGNPRGVDGNGDGIPGCDIGAVERQPAA